MDKHNKILLISGYITSLCAFGFFSIFIILGLVQPGYNHTIDTISVLVLGQWGWVQNLNFIILVVGLAAVGVGLGVALEEKMFSSVSILFLITSFAVFSLIIFSADPVDRSAIQLIKNNTWQGTIHFNTTRILPFLMIPLFYRMVMCMKKHSRLKSFYKYTLFVFCFNFVFGTLWFVCRRYGILFEWKGLWQKILVANVLVWMMVMGNALVHLRSVHGGKEI